MSSKARWIWTINLTACNGNTYLTLVHFSAKFTRLAERKKKQPNFVAKCTNEPVKTVRNFEHLKIDTDKIKKKKKRIKQRECVR